MSKEDFTLAKGYEKIKNSKNNIILFGPVGSGKTTILNKICGCNFQTESLTRDVHYSFSLKYNNIVFDFPELNSAVNIYYHLKVQKNALSVIPVKMICFIIRFTKRYDELIESVSQMLMIFKEYRKNICLIISHSEEAIIINRAEIELIFKTKFGINKIIFSTLNISELEILDKLEKFKQDMPFIDHLNIKTSDLTKTVNPQFDLDCIDDREKYIKEFQNALKIFKAEFSKTNEKNLKRALYFAFRDYKDNLIKKYSEILRGKKADTDSIITELIMFNNEIFNEYNGLKQRVESELDTQIKNLNGEYRYKKCPNCGIIWLLESECQNMICGERSNFKDKVFLKYDDKKIGDKKKWFGLNKEEKLENKKRGIGKALIQPLGCGKTVKLDEMEDVTGQIPQEFKIIFI